MNELFPAPAVVRTDMLTSRLRGGPTSSVADRLVPEPRLVVILTA